MWWKWHDDDGSLLMMGHGGEKNNKKWLNSSVPHIYPRMDTGSRQIEVVRMWMCALRKFKFKKYTGPTVPIEETPTYVTFLSCLWTFHIFGAPVYLLHIAPQTCCVTPLTSGVDTFLLLQKQGIVHKYIG